jgi:transposase
MSMRPYGPGEIPPETVRVTRAAFSKGSLAIRIRDELGVLFSDGQFAGLFPARGKPAWSPGRLALVLVLQFVEGLTDRQAAEAVRARIDFKYALGLDLSDPGFDFSVLSEFRDRLVEAEAGRRVLDGILMAAREKGLLKTAGRAGTDSAHVLSAAGSCPGSSWSPNRCGPRSTHWLRPPPSGWPTSRRLSRTGSSTTQSQPRNTDSPRAAPNGKKWRYGSAGTEHACSVVRAQFSARDCRPCPVVYGCVPASKDKDRAIALRPQQAHHELMRARALQQADEWKERYKIRTGAKELFLKAQTGADYADPATKAWRRPASNTSSPAPQ